jgi:hypothetical protein
MKKLYIHYRIDQLSFYLLEAFSAPFCSQLFLLPKKEGGKKIVFF